MSPHNLLLYVSIPYCLLTLHMPHIPHTPPFTHPHMPTTLSSHTHAHTSLYTPSHAHNSLFTHTCTHLPLHTLTCPQLSFTHTCTPSHPHTSFHTHARTHTSLHIHTHLPSSHTQIAAQSLREVTDEFLEEGNPIITVAKKMSQQMFQMAEFTHGRGELRVCTFLSVCPSIYLSVSLSVYLSVCLSVCPSIYLAVSLSICLSGCQFFSDVCITFPCYSFTHLYSPSSCSLSSPPPLFLYHLHPSRVSQK